VRSDRESVYAKRIIERGLNARLRVSNLQGAGIAVDERRSAPKEVRTTRSRSRGVYLPASRLGSRRSDGVPPGRDNPSRLTDEVAWRSPGCHGRGREFESRRPRHSFQGTCMDFDEPNGGVQKDTLCRPLCTLFSARPELFSATHVIPRCVCERSSEASFRRKPQRERCRLDVWPILHLNYLPGTAS
jgi:hypothetical protein